jgi:putative transposase
MRHGTTTLLAALDIAHGKVFTAGKPRRRHQEFLSFLRPLDQDVPAAYEVHLIVDNYATHKHPKVRTWRAQRPRYPMHYTPTDSAWLNQVERWFGIVTQRAIRRGSFPSVHDLVEKFDAFVQRYNHASRPLVWTATADSRLQKSARLCSRISGT